MSHSYTTDNANLYAPSQKLGTGDVFEGLNLAEYRNELFKNFQPALVISSSFRKIPITGTNAVKIDIEADASTSNREWGVADQGENKPVREDRFLRLDQKPRKSTKWVPYDWVGMGKHANAELWGSTHADAIAKEIEQRACVALYLGSTASAESADFNAGKSVSVSGATVAAAFPKSLTGSRTLQDAIEQIGLDWDQKFVPANDRKMFLSPYLYQVLCQDNTLMSYDFQSSTNDFLTQQVKIAKDFMIFKAPYNAFASSSYGTSYEEPNYQADMSLVAAVGCQGMDAVWMGQAHGEDIRTLGPAFYEDRDSWYFGAQAWYGMAYARPECCCSIVITGS